MEASRAWRGSGPRDWLPLSLLLLRPSPSPQPQRPHWGLPAMLPMEPPPLRHPALLPCRFKDKLSLSFKASWLGPTPYSEIAFSLLVF